MNFEGYEISTDHNGDVHLYHTACHKYINFYGTGPLRMADVAADAEDHQEREHTLPRCRQEQYGVMEDRYIDGRFGVWDRPAHKFVDADRYTYLEAAERADEMNASVAAAIAA